MLPLVNVAAIKKFNNKKPQRKDEPDEHNRRQFPDLKIYDTRSSTSATSKDRPIITILALPSLFISFGPQFTLSTHV